jgi:hypothetical protein
MHSGASFFLESFFNLEAEFCFVLFCVSSSGILSVNLMRMMRNSAVLHVKGSAIVPFVVVNGVNHMLESGPAILHHHQLSSGLV